MEELTSGQREPLFQLVRHQQKSKTEVIFAVSGGWDLEITPWSERTSKITHIPKETLEVWTESNYITASEREIGGGPLASSILTFALRQEALEYENFMRKPRLIRGIVRLWGKLAEDIPSLVWGVVGGTMTVIILKLLGLS